MKKMLYNFISHIKMQILIKTEQNINLKNLKENINKKLTWKQIFSKTFIRK